MANHSAIEWTDATWNPVAGCSLVSPGCTNCYAMRRVAPRLAANPATPHYAGTVTTSRSAPVWTGRLGIAGDQVITKPLRWKEPRRIFVNSTSDLFHEDLPDAVIDRIFAVMALTPRHTFQVLTKRSARMREYVSRAQHDTEGARRIRRAGHALCQRNGWDGDIADTRIYEALFERPLPNVWLGVSAEDQRRADERVPDLLATPAAIRFVSAEPLLGPIDLSSWLSGCYECAVECGWRSGSPPRCEGCRNCGWVGEDAGEFCPSCGAQDFAAMCPQCDSHAVHLHPDTPTLDWIIVGGESGRDARPMHPDWARAIRDQCAAAGTAFFFKQWGEWEPVSETRHVSSWGRDWMLLTKSGIMDLPDESFPDETAGDVAIAKVGKHRAGRLLDCVEHNAFPQVAS